MPAIVVETVGYKHYVSRVPETGETRVCAICVGVYVDVSSPARIKLDWLVSRMEA